MGYDIKDSDCNSSSPTQCTFDYINGGVIMTMCTTGIFLNLMVLFVIVIAKVPLGGQQKYFMVNLAIADLFLSVVGFQRGLGLILPDLFEGGTSTSAYCVLFSLLLNYIGFINNCALVPITLERFIAIVYPFHHKDILTKRNCLIVCALTWLPNTIFLAIEVISYIMPAPTTLQIVYQPNYHRCVYLNFDGEVFAKEIICFIIPFLIILTVYSTIFKVLIQNRIKTKRILFISLLIVVTGIISWAPTVIIRYGSIALDYKATHILTVTLFYTIGVTDPLIYIFGYPTVKAYLKGQPFRDPSLISMKRVRTQSQLRKMSSVSAMSISNSFKRKAEAKLNSYEENVLVEKDEKNGGHY